MPIKEGPQLPGLIPIYINGRLAEKECEGQRDKLCIENLGDPGCGSEMRHGIFIMSEQLAAHAAQICDSH